MTRGAGKNVDRVALVSPSATFFPLGEKNVARGDFRCTMSTFFPCRSAGRAFERTGAGKPRRKMSTPEDKPATGFPEPPGRDPGDISHDEDPHHALNTPVGEPDPTEWPDPYERRPDPRDPADPDNAPFGEEPHPGTGSTSTSEPHPAQDPEAEPWEGPKRDKVDE